MLCPADIFLAANLSLNNLSLVLITLSLNQVIRRAQVLQSMLLVSACAWNPHYCPTLPTENVQLVHGAAHAVEALDGSCSRVQPCPSATSMRLPVWPGSPASTQKLDYETPNAMLHGKVQHL